VVARFKSSTDRYGFEFHDQWRLYHKPKDLQGKNKLSLQMMGLQDKKSKQ